MARNLVRYVDFLPFFYGVGVIAIFVTRQHQRLGDLAAGTLVVRDLKQAEPAWATPGQDIYRTELCAQRSGTGAASRLHAAGDRNCQALDDRSGGSGRVFSRRLDMSLPTRQPGRTDRPGHPGKIRSGATRGRKRGDFSRSTARQLRDQARMQ